jgi:sulfite reductase (ferredoxin)
MDVERIKAESRNLRGNIAEEIAAPASGVGGETAQLLKFHGIYQQEDRDRRKERKAEGAAKEHTFMLRTKSPGGYVPAVLYLALDELADSFGSGTIRITTREALQLHGVRKSDLRATIAQITRRLGSTLGACGDINRNVMAPPAPFAAPAYRLAREAARAIAELLTPRTGAYYEIWQDGEPVYRSQEEETEPIYGAAYLPRKFKIAVAAPGDNSVDIYTNDLGVVPVLGEHGVLLGYDLTIGGGLGKTHNKPETFPRLADHFGFVEPHELLPTVRAAVLVQRDNGDRSNRRHARLKYLIADRGISWFRAEVERVSGVSPKPWRELPPWTFRDYLGWHEQGDGKYFLGLPVLGGRVRDGADSKTKAALRRIVAQLDLDLVFTPNQNVLIVGVPERHRASVDAILAEHHVPTAATISTLERRALACPALPTCSLALAEAERVLPELLRNAQRDLDELGLAEEEISIRMTGCPNGCARPYMGEIGIVGVSADLYNIYAGGDADLTRLNALYREKVRLAEIPAILRALFIDYKTLREPGEPFGDFSLRAGRGEVALGPSQSVNPALA